MNNSSRHILIIIAAIAFAMVGLIALQVYLLKGSYEAKEQAFDRNVINALASVSQQIEKEEAASKIFSVATEPPGIPGVGSGVRMRKEGKLRLPQNAEGMQGITWVVAESAMVNSGTEMRVEVFHSGGIDTLPSMIIKKRNGGRQRKNTQSFSYRYSTDDKTMKISAAFGDSAVTVMMDTTRKRKGEIVARVVDKLFLLEVMPIERRVDNQRLDSSIRASLRSVGVSAPYLYRVTAGHPDSVKLTNDTARTWSGAQDPFTVRLFPNDVIPGRYDLALMLPEKMSYVLGEMGVLLGLSLLFAVMLIVSMAVTVRTLLMQKRFGDSIVDFINNMTHEFKTPISTIALASEAIAKPEVMKSRPKLRRYNTLIADENNRMKHQVDTILQMAVLERGEFELKMGSVDMHDVIQRAAANAAVQTELRHGMVTAELNARNPVVKGDPLHLANIIHNLLDNAVKYSPAVPAIVVSTSDAPEGVRIRVKDNGIGIAKEHLPRLFEKYYRVPTGNMHDVKGFGLGLSYVALIVKAHGGTVTIDSVPGSGTTVEVILPV